MRAPVLFLARAGLAQSCTGLRRLPSLTRATVERTCGDVLFLLSQDGPLCGPRASLCGDHPRGSGSTCGVSAVCLPGRLANPRNLSPQCQAAEAQPAKAELAQIGARASAQLAAVVLARRELGLLIVLGDAGCSGHCFLYLSLRSLCHPRLHTWGLLRSLAAFACNHLPATVAGGRKKKLNSRPVNGTASRATSAEPARVRRSAPWSQS